MPTGRSIVQGIGITAAGCLATYIVSHVWGDGGGSGSVPYLVESSKGIADIIARVGYLGSIGAGIYWAGWGPTSRQQPPGPPAGQGPGAPQGPIYNINIRNNNRPNVRIGP